MEILKLQFSCNGKSCYLILLLFLFLTGTSYGQEPPAGSYPDGTSAKIIPPSPEAASLGKYGFWPVSNYTGVPNISVPVYTISTGSYSLPVSISYHAGGVKIDEKSSWAGTNWTLLAGGAINVTVVGKPDALTSEKTLKNAYDPGSDYQDYTFIANSLRENGPDAEQDIYAYNFGGFSGKFFLDTNFNVHTIPVSNLNFLQTPFSSSFQSGGAMWIIADEKGNRYFFAQNNVGTERTISYRGNVGGNSMITAYYLTQIILPNNADTIKFNYAEKGETYRLPYAQSLRTAVLDIHNGISSPDPNGITVYDCGGTTSYGDRYKTNRILYNGAELNDRVPTSLYNFGYTQLQSISWRGGTVTFSANTIRQDMLYNTAKLLDSIVVADQNNQRIKAVQLKQSFVNGRYFLDSLIEEGTDAQSFKKYAFYYFNKGFLPPAEPLKDQNTALNPYAQDHWGYYNGAAGNNSLLPSSPYMPAAANSYLTSNREPDSLTMQYGVLNKIVYPTGGFTQFDYEPNRYNPATTLNPTPPSVIPAASGVQMNMFMPVKNTTDFTVDFDQANVGITISFNDYNHPSSKGQTVFSYARLEKKLSNGSYQQLHYWDSFDNFPTTSISANPRGYYDFQVQESFTLLAGEYRLVVNDSCSNMIDLTGNLGNCLSNQYPDQEEDYWLIPRVGMSVSYQGYASSQSVARLPYAGGLRIKRMASFDGVSATPSVKEFEYGQGNLMKYPSRYISIYNSSAGVLNNCYSSAVLKEITSTSQVIPGYTQGAIVGYDTVIEKDVAGGISNGFTRYRYSYTPDSLNLLHFDASYWSYVANLNSIGTFSYDAADPTFPSNSFDYKSGLLLSRAVYKNNSPGQPVLIDSLANTYEFNDYNAQKGYFRRRSIRARQLDFYTDSRTLVENQNYPFSQVKDSKAFAYAFYDNITSWVQLSSTKEIKYDQNGANPLTTVTDYEYNDKNLLANKITATNSKGEKNITRITYPADYTISGTPSDDMAKGIRTLQDNYVLAAPVEQRIQKANADGSNVRTLSSTLFTYKATVPFPAVIYKTNNSQPLTDFAPVSINASTSAKDNRYQPILFLHQYDAYGNLLERQKENDTKEVYLWGYKGQYPVAQVLGSNQATVSALVNQSVLDNPSSDAALRAELGSLRSHSSLANALVTTYTYKPLLGMTSQTDANGKTIYYEYDAFGRLSFIRDQDNNIVKRYCYNYQGQTEACPVTPAPGGTVYLQRSYENIEYSMNGEAYGDVVVRFYADAACTQPLSVSNLTVSCTRFDPCGGLPCPLHGCAWTATANGSSCTLATGEALSYIPPSNNCSWVYYGGQWHWMCQVAQPCDVDYPIDESSSYTIIP